MKHCWLEALCARIPRSKGGQAESGLDAGVDELDDGAVDLGLAAAVTELLAGVVGSMPILSIEIEHSDVPLPCAGCPSARWVPTVDVRVHCKDDTVAGEFAAVLDLARSETRRYPIGPGDSVVVESSWSGWLTRPDAARLAAPVAVRVLGSHSEARL